jgi:predicted TIM-barrel fold metal-dependent hydrolase
MTSFIDADTHYYEPEDCFTRHLEARFRDRAVHVRRHPSSTIGRMFVGDAPLRFLPRYPTDEVARPGALTAFFRGQIPRSEIREGRVNAADVPAFVDRDARLTMMDEQGVDAALVFPSLGGCVEPDLRHDPELLAAHFRAFNRWIEEDWGFHHLDRLFAVPLLSLVDAAEAEAELGRVLAAGARVVHLQAMPVDGRSPGDPQFDGFWGLLAEANVPLAIHVGDSGYVRSSAAWGEDPDVEVGLYSAFQRVLAFMDRPIMDMLAALTLHNVFGRHPSLRVLSVENGCAWVPYLLKVLDKAVLLSESGPWLGGRLSDRPSELFRAHVYVSPFFEENIKGLVHLIGAERVLLGSDYPHAEGVTAPAQFLPRLEGLTPRQIGRVIRDNTAGLLGLAPAPVGGIGGGQTGEP